MQNERDKVINILKTNLPAIVVILLMTIALNIALDYNVFLSFIVLSIAYVVLGIVIEMILERFSSTTTKTYERQAHSQTSTKSVQPKLVDLTHDENISIKKKPVKKITTSPSAAVVAQRLKKTKLNFDDLLALSDTAESKSKDETVVFTQSKVSVINDYSTLLNKVKAKENSSESEANVSKTVSVEKITETVEKDIKVDEEDTFDEEFSFDDNDNFDEFSVKSADTIEYESKKIQSEIDKRLLDNKSTVVPPIKKKTTSLLESLSFNFKSKEEEKEEVEEEVEDLDDFQVVKEEETYEEEVLDDVSFDVEAMDENGDKAVADRNLINELYTTSKEPEVKKKQPFWKRLFR